VKSDEEEVLNALQSKGKSIDEETLEEWSEQGLAFPSTPEGVRLMHITEEKKRRVVGQTMKKPSSMKFSSADLYVNAGTDRCVASFVSGYSR
jgi:hypothetical protein